MQIDLVRQKIGRIRHVAELLSVGLPSQPEALVNDEDALHLVAFRVYLGLQEALDLASHLVADQGWGPAASLREHFEILARQGVLDARLAATLADGVKIRNLIGHAYGELDPDSDGHANGDGHANAYAEPDAEYLCRRESAAAH